MLIDEYTYQRDTDLWVKRTKYIERRRGKKRVWWNPWGLVTVENAVTGFDGILALHNGITCKRTFPPTQL